MRVAVQGCCHGELDKIFKEVERLNLRRKIDLLLILGDFQSIRNPQDFYSINVPAKYQRYGDFSKYYRNSRMQAPVPTIFIGGNHESMRHLSMLPYGGYVCNNVFYLGYSGVIWYRGMRIGGISGIYKQWDYFKRRLDWNTIEEKRLWLKQMRNLYHVRVWDVMPLMLLSFSEEEGQRMDIMMSHDWPNEVVYHGDYNDLIRRKPFFQQDISKRELGSTVNWELLQHIKPEHWLSAHLHCRYTAQVQHNKRKRSYENQNEIPLDLEEDEAQPKRGEEQRKSTSFLALDKCLPRRRHLEVIEVEADTTHPSYKQQNIYWDPEYIDALRYTQEKLTVVDPQNLPNSAESWDHLRRAYQAHGKHENHEAWDYFAVPMYRPDIQQHEQDQTSTFVNRYLSASGNIAAEGIQRDGVQ